MENLFGIPVKNRCRECKHIANLNPHSDRYWYCAIQKCNRTPYGVKAVKRMNQACDSIDQLVINNY